MARQKALEPFELFQCHNDNSSCLVRGEVAKHPTKEFDLSGELNV